MRAFRRGLATAFLGLAWLCIEAARGLDGVSLADLYGDKDPAD